MSEATGTTPATVLGIDTSHDVRVGVARDGVVLARAAVTDTRQHVEELMPLVRRALAEAGLGIGDLTAVAVGLGPGPFTGLRVGIATAGTLAEVRGLPVHGVCSLDVVAAQHVEEQQVEEQRPGGEFLVAGDARRSELYWARYDATGRRVDGPHVGPPTDLPALPVVGPGAHVHAGLDAVAGPDSVDAGLLAARNTAIPAAGEGLEPLYLRRPDAAVSTRRKSALAVPRVRRRAPKGTQS